MEQYSRTEIILGKDGMDKLANSRVAVFGIGGVGGYVVEALARSGIMELDLIDDDKVSITNLNRQIIATRRTLGMYKVDAAEERIHEINPDITVRKYKIFYLPETKSEFDFSNYDYVVDAIDTVTAKLDLVEEAKHNGVPIISSMGAGNKLDASAFEVADISKTSVDPLARVMRRELRKRGINHLKVVYSKEVPIKRFADSIHSDMEENNETRASIIAKDTAVKKAVPGSMAFVPAAAGMIIAGEVIKELSGIMENNE